MRCVPLLSKLVCTSSSGVKDLDPPLTVVHDHDPSGLGAQCKPGGVHQGSPPAKGVVPHLGSTSGSFPVSL
uniref:Uncharacterized protein n=1 Tax=Peromyscus maniculatus bairdii TaxID=230844 RepID=A0A8C8W2P2_PERMB